MATINELTQDQFTQLLDEYFAPPEKRSKMTEEEVKDLAERLNEKINVPIINETGEEKILIKIIIKIDRFLYNNLPNEFYDLVRSLDNGIDDDEAKRLVKRLSKLANKHIDIPYIPEQVEYIAIRFVIGIIINAARKQWDMARSKAELTNANIPNSENASDIELESIIQ
ncbi:MAG: hypothetical protein AAF149_10040 [Bacteroidota bacterium]